MLGSTVCAGGRLALRASSVRPLARASLQHRGRPFVFQHLQGSLGRLPSRPSARNYWWSKPATSELANPTGPPSPEPVARASSEGAASSRGTPAPTDPVDPAGVPAPEVLLTDASAPASGISEVVNAIPPLQYGDFAALGITNWWPSGVITWSFELLQVSTGMPWFYTIVAGTLFWRAVLIPATLTGIRNAARLGPYAEQIKGLDDKAQGVKDRAAQMEIMLKKQKLLEKAGVSMASMFTPIIPVVGNLGLFFAIKGMVQLPVAQLTQSGVWFLPDLTLTGDYVMPTLVLLLMNFQLSAMQKDLDQTKIVMAHTLNVFRLASFITLPMMSGMATGLWLSVVSGLVLGIVQSALLRVPRIRQALSIPPTTPRAPVTMRDTGRAILETIRQKRMEIAANQAANQRGPNWASLPKASRRR